MNNDISRDIASYSKKVQIPTGRIEVSKSAKTVSIPDNESELSGGAMDCLGTLGYAQVNMGKNDSIRKSVEEFTADPFLAEVKTEFCDDLVQNQDYDIWQAMKITDNFFTALEKEDTYRN